MNKPECWNVTMIFTQEPDDAGEEAPQEITITAHQVPGGGWYYVLKTDRWAIDDESEIVELIERLKTKEEKC